MSGGKSGELSARRYTVRFTSSASRELKALTVDVQRAVLAEVEQLAETPRPQGARRLQGALRRFYRVRVTGAGDFRIVYQIEDDVLTVTVVRVRNRRDAYRA